MLRVDASCDAMNNRGAVGILMKRFGIYTNVEKDPDFHATKTVMESLRSHGCEVLLDDATARAMGCEEQDALKAQVLFVLGGDGTLLHAAHKYVKHDILLVGLNMGRLGFISEADLCDIDFVIERILAGNYVVDERMMLEADVPGYGKILALNEVVITLAHRIRMLQLELKVNGTQAEHYNGDGIIVATSTGSTAYALSAGGPIISPSVSCMLITPICPHSLYARSIVVSDTHTIAVSPRAGYRDVVVCADGRDLLALEPDAVVQVRRAEETTKFLRMSENSFFPQLKDKLAQWSINPKGASDS